MAEYEAITNVGEARLRRSALKNLSENEIGVQKCSKIQTSIREYQTEQRGAFSTRRATTIIKAGKTLETTNSRTHVAN